MGRQEHPGRAQNGSQAVSVSRLDALMVEELERRQRAIRAINLMIRTLNTAADAIYMGKPPPVATLHHSAATVQDHCTLWDAANQAVEMHLESRGGNVIRQSA